MEKESTFKRRRLNNRFSSNCTAQKTPDTHIARTMEEKEKETTRAHEEGRKFTHQIGDSGQKRRAVACVQREP